MKGVESNNIRTVIWISLGKEAALLKLCNEICHFAVCVVVWMRYALILCGPCHVKAAVCDVSSIASLCPLFPFASIHVLFKVDDCF